MKWNGVQIYPMPHMKTFIVETCGGCCIKQLLAIISSTVNFNHSHIHIRVYSKCPTNNNNEHNEKEKMWNKKL